MKVNGRWFVRVGGTALGAVPGLDKLVFRRLGSHVTGLAKLVDVEAIGREFGNLASAARGHGNVEDVSADEAADRAFIHR